MRFCYYCMTQINNENAHSCPKCGKSLMDERQSPKFLKPGTVIGGRFIVGHPLGAGGFGNTYIGWNQVLLRKVAIKEFFPAQYAERMPDGKTITVIDEKHRYRFQNGLRQFLEEARSVATLQDIKGVVAISNFFEENGSGYIIMEYLEGMDVKTILQKSGNNKDYEWCRRVVLTILYTLRDIHRRGVLHRDIAPDNIFVTNEGVIKLIDFGAAKHASALANTGAEIMLKVGYAPIEQYSRNTPQGPYTDIYAVAALFYRMLTGQKPLPANKRLEDDKLITPSQMGIAIPEQAELGIMVCLNVKPEYRLQSADEFMEVLGGKSFVPVYEPKWILPPVVEKKTFSQLPIAAKVSIGFLVLCLVGGIALTATYVIKKNSDTKQALSDKSGEIVIADYSGESLDTTVEQLENELGITNIKLVYEFHNNPIDTVIGQFPQPGTIDNNEAVVLNVSGGSELYTINDFVGKSKDEIIDWFLRYNFDVYINEYPNASLDLVDNSGTNQDYPKQSGSIILEYEYSEQKKKDTCLKQSLDSGVVCSSKDDVVFTLSAGKISDYEIMIPDLEGMKLSKAEDELNKLRLDELLEIVYVDEDGKVFDGKEGTIVEQSHEGGSIYNRLEEKVYTYSKGVRAYETGNKRLRITVKAEKKKETKTPETTPQPTPTPAPTPAPQPEPAPAPATEMNGFSGGANEF